MGLVARTDDADTCATSNFEKWDTWRDRSRTWDVVPGDWTRCGSPQRCRWWRFPCTRDTRSAGWRTSPWCWCCCWSTPGRRWGCRLHWSSRSRVVSVVSCDLGEFRNWEFFPRHLHRMESWDHEFSGVYACSHWWWRFDHSRRMKKASHQNEPAYDGPEKRKMTTSCHKDSSCTPWPDLWDQQDLE